jgi:hypothetical protein
MLSFDKKPWFHGFQPNGTKAFLFNSDGGEARELVKSKSEKPTLNDKAPS